MAKYTAAFPAVPREADQNPDNGGAADSDASDRPGVRPAGSDNVRTPLHPEDPARTGGRNPSNSPHRRREDCTGGEGGFRL